MIDDTIKLAIIEVLNDTNQIKCESQLTHLIENYINNNISNIDAEIKSLIESIKLTKSDF